MSSTANPPTQSRVSPETIQKAIDALLKWRKSTSSNKPQKLFDNDEEFIYLVLTLKKIPQKDHTNGGSSSSEAFGEAILQEEEGSGALGFEEGELEGAGG
ncbi:hypothetical protein PIB30_093642 [Stylosanthes scabra]|uniref:Uncharacterized protein n=1 Tax=Stylosanthes scabra TaxID=79078 RepID=A0ABU6YWI6_9FABA|nr:hypothetical protein [Stylosanthes scabra]